MKKAQLNTFAIYKDSFHPYLNVFIKIKVNFYVLSKDDRKD